MSYRPHSIISRTAAMNTELTKTQNKILKSGKNQRHTEARRGDFEHLLCIQQ
jgi:hypothetical protein